MARKFLTPIDLNQNEIRNALLQQLSADPGSPLEGQFWVNTTAHDVRIRNNGATVSLLPSSLLATANTWTANQTVNANILGNGTIALTGAGASSVGGTLGATAHIATGLTGAVAASRYVGATASGAPATGAFVLGDFVVDQTGTVWVCTVAGSPGTWKRAADYLLGVASSWTAAQTFTAGIVANSAITGNGTLTLTGAGASSVGGNFSAVVNVSTGLTGATAATRYVGGTATGAPASGTFAVGDFVITQNGHMFICTAAGTPGTWVDVAGSAVTPASSVVADQTFGAASVVGVSLLYARQDHSHGSPTHLGADHAAISISSLSAPTGDVAWGSHKITGLLDPTNPQDAATKNYVDNAVAGLAWKDAVQVATTAALPANNYANGAAGVGATLTATANGVLAAQDGYTPVVGDRILVKNEATAANNGIYTVTSVGSAGATWVLTRATDADTAAELQGAATFVMNGPTNGGLAWTMTQTAAITVGTTALPWSIQSGANAVTAGNGLTATGNQFNVGAGTGIVVAADTVSVDTAVVARKFTQLIGTGAATSIAVTHSLGNQWCTVEVFNAASPFDLQECDIQLTDANTVTLLFTVAPATNALRVVVTG
jgi:hypothetical protein